MRKKYRIEISVSAEIKERVIKSAERANMTVSDYCVGMLLNGKVHAALSSEQLKLMRSLADMHNDFKSVLANFDMHWGARPTLEKVISKIEEILS